MPLLLGLFTVLGLAYAIGTSWLLMVCIPMLAVFGTLGASLGLGWLIDRSLPWDVAGMLGIGLMGMLLLPISIFCGPRIGIMILIIGWLQLWRLRWYWSLQWSYQGFMVMVFAIFAVWNAQQPLVDTDSLYYHVALPKHIWINNTLLGGELHPNASRPLIWHLPLTIAYGLGGVPAVVLMASSVAIAAWCSLSQTCDGAVKGTGWWVWALVLGSYSLLEQTMVVANNIVVLWWVVLAYRERQRPWLFGALLGFAVVGKFTAGAIVILIGVFTVGSLINKLKTAVLGWGLIVVWLIRNWAEGVHPLFPFVGWELDIPFVWVEKYGMGRSLVDFLLAPWNLLVHAEVDTFRFLGQLSPAFGLLFVWGGYDIVRYRRWRVGSILLGAYIWWFIGPHWIRHLFPFAGVFILLSVERLSIRWFHHVLFGAACLLGLSNNVVPFVQHQIERVNGGLEPVGTAATRWLNQYATDGKIAMLCLWTVADLDRPYVLASVEDHTPVRHWSLKYKENSILKLKEEGVRYVAFGPHTFYPSAYPFLSQAELERDFVAPMKLLEDQLLLHGRKIVRLDGVDIYRLD